MSRCSSLASLPLLWVLCEVVVTAEKSPKNLNHAHLPADLVGAAKCCGLFEETPKEPQAGLPQPRLLLASAGSSQCCSLAQSSPSPATVLSLPQGMLHLPLLQALLPP